MKYLYSLAIELRHLKDINRRYIWKKEFCIISNMLKLPSILVPSFDLSVGKS